MKLKTDACEKCEGKYRENLGKVETYKWLETVRR
jgi:hypothetical protein